MHTCLFEIVVRDYANGCEWRASLGPMASKKLNFEQIGSKKNLLGKLHKGRDIPFANVRLLCA